MDIEQDGIDVGCILEVGLICWCEECSRDELRMRPRYFVCATW